MTNPKDSNFESALYAKLRLKAVRTLSHMKMRCRNPKDVGYKLYGAKGITVSPEWETFAAFIKSVGMPPTLSHSIDRIDNSRGYEPGNCRWVDSTLQQHNRPHSKRGGKGMTAYRGVHKRGHKFIASSVYRKEKVTLYSWDNAEDAAIVYDFMALMFHGDDAVTNFKYEVGSGM